MQSAYSVWQQSLFFNHLNSSPVKVEVKGNTTSRYLHISFYTATGQQLQPEISCIAAEYWALEFPYGRGVLINKRNANMFVIIEIVRDSSLNSTNDLAFYECIHAFWKE